MKTNNSQLKLLLIVSCLLIHDFAGAEECYFAKKLHDPYVRAEYKELIAENKTKDPGRDVEEWYGNIQPTSFSEDSEYSGVNMNNPYDEISMECVSCHDGVLATDAKHRLVSDNFIRVKNIETIKGAHPVGMNYGDYEWDRKYEKKHLLPADMVFMGGRVSCVTCHNMLGKNKMYLAVDNSGSRLCFSCHIK